MGMAAQKQIKTGMCSLTVDFRRVRQKDRECVIGNVGCRLFDVVDGAGLPDMTTLPERERLSRLRSEFERTYATNHPLRGALSVLRSLEIVRTIEGES